MHHSLSDLGLQQSIAWGAKESSYLLCQDSDILGRIVKDCDQGIWVQSKPLVAMSAVNEAKLIA